MRLSLLFSFALIVTSAMAHSAPTFVYLGTQNPSSMGIALSRFDSVTGELSPPKLLAQTRDPAFFVIHPSGNNLYICNTGTPGGVSAFVIDTSSGALKLLNHKVSVGRGPSHIGLDRSGRYVLDANYGGGYVEIHELLSDGRLGKQTALVEHRGSSVHPERQTKAYAHWFGVDPTNKFALAADLGTDRIVIYRFDASEGSLEPAETPHAAVRAGSGPRHLAWHPDGKFVYAIQELTNQIIAFSWDSDKGILTELQTIGTLPADFKGTNTAAEIAVHANGRFLYASNRGHDSIAVYAIDKVSRHLTLLQHVSSGGKIPRYFAFDPTNQWMIVSNQDSDNVVVFHVDESSGAVKSHGTPIALTKPMAVGFTPERK